MFKEMVEEIMENAKAQVNLDSVMADKNYHTAIDRLVESHNEIESYHTDEFRKSTQRTLDRVMNSASHTDNDKFYSSSNSEMYRERRLENKWNFERTHSYLSDDARFDYLCKSAGIASKKAKASIKEHKSIPQASYLPQKPIASNKDYTPSLQDFNTYKIVSYKIYHKAIVLEIKDSEIERNEYLNRQTHEVNALTQHIVFRYVPFGRDGKPNKYDGIKQLRDFLHSLGFVANENPTTIKQALEIVTGYDVNIPKALHYNYSHKSDNLTVYTVFGDFTDFDLEFSKE